MNQQSTLLTTMRGAKLVDRSKLKLISPPEATETWKPVAHMDLLEGIEAQLASRDITIRKESLAVQQNGNLFFAVLDLNMVVDEKMGLSSSMGIRASNNKRISIQIAVGARVFVCDNLAFYGDLIALKRKHTSGLVLEDELSEAIDSYAEKFAMFSQEIKMLAGIEVSDSVAKEVIFDSFVERRILPVRCLNEVAGQYFQPKFKEFEPRTAWSLHNAFTFAAKDLSQSVRFKALKEIGDFFQDVAIGKISMK